MSRPRSPRTHSLILLTPLIGLLAFQTTVSRAQLNEQVIDPGAAGASTNEDADVFTLDEALARVEERAPNVRIADSQIEEAILRRLEVKMERVPEFSARIGFGPGPSDVDPDPNSEDLRYFRGITMAGQAGLTLPITTFGKISTGLDLAAMGVASERIQAESARLEARYQAYRAYLGAQWYERARRLLDEAEGRVGQAEESLLDALDDGDYTVRNDLRQLDILRADLVSMRNDSEEAGFLARAGLHLILGVAETTRLEDFATDVPTVEPPDFETVFAVARDLRPDLRRVEVGVRARELELQLQKKQVLPDIFFAAQGEITWTPTLEGRPSITENSNNFNEITGILALGARWKLNPGVQRARVRRLEQRLETMRQTRDGAEVAARLEIREAYLQAVNAQRMLAASHRAQRSAEAWLNQTGFQYRQGLADFKEFGDPLKAYYQRSAAYLRDVLTYRLRLANLAVKVGSPDLRHWPGLTESASR